MSAQRFRPGARIRWTSDARNGTYEIKRLLPDGQARIEDILMETEEAVTVAEMVGALFAGNLQFVLTGRQVKGEHGTDQGVETVYPTLDDCPEPLVAVARFRLECIEPLLKDQRSTRQEVRDRVDAIKALLRERDDDDGVARHVSVASLYRWRADYVRSGCDLRSLIPATLKRGGKGVPRMDADVNTALEAVIREKYLVREQVTIDNLRDEVAQRIVEMRPMDGMTGMTTAPRGQDPVPSRSTIKRRIDMLDMEEVLRAKRGNAVAKRALTQYGMSDAPTLPLERVEIDHTRSDLIVLDDADDLPLGRLTLTYCLDVATRYPLGYYLGFEPPSYLAVMECLYHAIWPKESVREAYGTEHEWLAYGVPSTLVIDNGREFIGPSLRDACLLLGTTLQRTPVKSPHFKGTIERALGSANTMLLHTLPGTTFSNTQRRGDYDAEKQACVYLSEIDRILTLFFVDIHAERYHRGLHGVPARRWEAAVRSGFIPRVPSSADELRLLLGRVDHRTIQHYGIEFENLIYNAPELVALRTRLRGARTKIKFHPGNMSRLHVHDAHDNRYIEVPALGQEYTQGLSLWKHRIIVATARAAGDKTDLAALGRARRKIQEVVDAGRARKRGGLRRRGARWDTAGAPTRSLGDKGTGAAGVETLPRDETVVASQAARREDHAAPFVPPSPETIDTLAAMIEGTKASDDMEGWGLDDTIPLHRLQRLSDIQIQERKETMHE